ncbi:MAG: hypothetical protein FWE26_00240 [Coriobacteriia bacterium]|nr:hypothetical protein [Coriobacteriia bacterium]
MFYRVLQDYIDTLNALSEFLRENHSKLVSESKTARETARIHEATKLLIAAKIDIEFKEYINAHHKSLPSEITNLINDDSVQVISEELPGNQLRYIIKGEDTHGVVEESIDLPVSFAGRKIIEDLINGRPYTKQMYINFLSQSVLQNVFNATEDYIYQVLRVLFNYDPSLLDGESIPFAQIRNIECSDGVLDIAIENKLQDLLRGSLDDWRNCLSTFTKNTCLRASFDRYWYKAIEIKLRRNLYTHNGGRSNSIYVSSLPESISSEVDLGVRLPLDPEYLMEAIEIYKIGLVCFTLNAWKKIEPESEKRIRFQEDAVYHEGLMKERWSFAEAIAEVALNDRAIVGESKRILQVNYYLAKKNLGTLTEADKESIKNKRDSGLNHVYEMVYCCLSDDFDGVGDRIDLALEYRDSEGNQLFDYEGLCQWPMLADFRRSEQFENYLSVNRQRVQAGVFPAIYETMVEAVRSEGH